MPDGTAQVESVNVKYSLLFEMLRSFTTLADTLNLSHAVARLDSTRQTVRRHISLLEEMKGGALFAVNQRQYALTELGKKILPEALDLLSQAEAWSSGSAQLAKGLPVLSSLQPDGTFYHQQQHQLLRVHNSDNTMLRDLLIGWAQAGGHIEHSAMAPLRKNAMVFRKSDDRWLFTEVGEHSGFATWFGWKRARSVIGRVMSELPRGASMARLIHSAYHEIEHTGGARLDHVFTMFPHGEDEVLTPLCFERLLLGVKFPDESFAIMSATRRTYDLEIEGVTPEMLRQMPEALLM
ncbi:MAG: LysR family transcriptional regulator [Pseudomonadota bacterium]